MSQSSSTTGGELPANQRVEIPAVTEFDDDEVIRCRNESIHGVTWYYAPADTSGRVVLYHEWDQFEPTSRKAFAARAVMNHPDVETATVSRGQLETLRGAGDLDGE